MTESVCTLHDCIILKLESFHKTLVVKRLDNINHNAVNDF